MIKLWFSRMGIIILMCMLLVVDVDAVLAKKPPPPIENSPENKTDLRELKAVSGYNGISTSNGGDGLSVYFAPDITTDATLFIQNLEPAIAQITLSFYKPDGTIVSTHTQNIYPNSTYIFTVAELVPHVFNGSAVISSDRQINAIVSLQNHDTMSLLSYNTFSSGTTKYYLPHILRNSKGWNTQFSIQNIGTSEANVTITYHPTTSGNSLTATAHIKPGASHTFRQADTTGLGDTFNGWVSITSDMKIVTVVEKWDTAEVRAAAFQGIDNLQTAYLIPWQQKNLDGWYSKTQILNPEGGSASLIAKFYNTDGTLICSESHVIPSGMTLELDLSANNNLPDGFDGALEIEANKPIAVLSDLLYSPATPQMDGFMADTGLPLALATNQVVLSYASNDLTKGLITQFSIQNAASSFTSVTIKFVGGNLTFQIADSIPPHGVNRYSTDTIAQLGTNWEGSITITANQTIVASSRLNLYYIESSVSGRVTDGASHPLSDVIIADNSGHLTTTDGNGYYSLSGLASGEYIVIPIRIGLTFSPLSRTISLPPDATGQDFVGSWIFKIFLPFAH